MKNNPQTIHNYVLEDEKRNLIICSYDEMLNHIKDDDSKLKVIGKLIKVTEIDAFSSFEKELRELRKFKDDYKIHIMKLVRENIGLLINRTKDNLIFNFRELVVKKL